MKLAASPHGAGIIPWHVRFERAWCIHHMRSAFSGTRDRPIAKRIYLALLPVLLATATFGCDNPTSANVISELQLRLAAQTPIRQHVRSVVVRMSGAAVRSTANSAFGTPGTLTHVIDLVELGGSDTRILEVLSLAEGRYDAVRLRIHEITVTLSNGTQFNEVYAGPLGGAFNVEADIAVVAERGRKADAVVDFDLLRSISFAGDTRRVHDIIGMRFAPVGRLVDLASAGQISGSVKHDNGTPAILRDDLPLIGYPVTVFQSGRTDSVTVYSDDDGRYSAYFMPAGSYALYGPATEQTRAWSTDNVVVTTASTTRQDIVATKR